MTNRQPSGTEPNTRTVVTRLSAHGRNWWRADGVRRQSQVGLAALTTVSSGMMGAAGRQPSCRESVNASPGLSVVPCPRSCAAFTSGRRRLHPETPSDRLTAPAPGPLDARTAATRPGSRQPSRSRLTARHEHSPASASHLAPDPTQEDGRRLRQLHIHHRQPRGRAPAGTSSRRQQKPCSAERRGDRHKCPGAGFSTSRARTRPLSSSVRANSSAERRTRSNLKNSNAPEATASSQKIGYGSRGDASRDHP